MTRRYVDIVVLSDIHLGTIGCHAKELLNYLKSIRIGTLILNGDIIDIWNFKKKYFPPDHLNVIQYVLKLAVKGTKVYYLTGNHDELLRKFKEIEFGAICVRDQLELNVSGKKVWIFHGDVFDSSIQHTKLLAKLGGHSYDLLIKFNRILNIILVALGYEKFSLSKKIKASVKKVVSYISDFEEIAASVAIEKGFDQVICGHIHQAQMRTIPIGDRSILYLNAGDWVESLTALEYYNNSWSLYYYPEEVRKLKIVKQQTPNTLESFEPKIMSNAGNA